MGVVLKSPYDCNLGADQLGELFGLVERHLVEGETWLVKEDETAEQDGLILHIVGSRGSYLVAQMTDKGWALGLDFEEPGEFTIKEEA